MQGTPKDKDRKEQSTPAQYRGAMYLRVATRQQLDATKNQMATFKEKQIAAIKPYTRQHNIEVISHAKD